MEGVDGEKLFRGVDGGETKDHLEVVRQFSTDTWDNSKARNPHQDHGWRAGVIGCAMSHLKAWRQIADTVTQRGTQRGANSGANSGSNSSTARHRPVSPYDMFLILEDDVRFSGDFADRWPRVREAAEVGGLYTVRVISFTAKD